MEPGTGSFDNICNLNHTTVFEYVSAMSKYDNESLTFFEKYRDICATSSSANTSWLGALWQQYSEYFYPNQVLRLYVPPVLLILGTLGNSFSFLILVRKHKSTYLYLAVLAILDLLVLYVGLLRLWIAEFTSDLQNTSNWLCKGINYLGYVTSDSSVWLIIAVTFERFIAVCFPLKAPSICNRSRTRIIIFVIICAMCILNIPIVWAVKIKTTYRSGAVVATCKAKEGYETLVKNIWPWIDTAVYSFIPFICIIILNSLMIRETILAIKRRQSLQTVVLLQAGGSVVRRRKSEKASFKETYIRQNRNNKRLVITLLCISFAFLLTTLPMNILQIITAFYGNTGDMDPDRYAIYFAKFTLARTVVELLMYANHSINFFFYCANGSEFRRHLKLLLQFGHNKVRRAVSYSRSRSQTSVKFV